MKNIVDLRVNFLRVYDAPREVTSKVNKVKSLRHGALILRDPLPDADGNPTGSNAIELSAKQLNNLCSIAGVRGVGAERWSDLSRLMQVNKSVATVTMTFHKKGETYVATDNTEAKYTEDGYNVSIDSIMLPTSVSNAFVEATIRKQLNFDSAVEALKDFELPEPILDVK